jgi:chemotaxis protein MotA
MELSTIIGLVTASVLVFLSISSNVRAFVDMPSIFIVLGGTLGATMVRFPFKVILQIPGVLKKTVFNTLQSPQDMIKIILSLSVEAKKNGILGLEKIPIENSFLKKGVQLAIDGVEPDLIESVLNIDIASTNQRHEGSTAVLSSCGEAAPAFGMIGTLIGLILMLGNMDDPKSIGPSMAVALITTLYGSILANIFFLPMADKLRYFHEQEMIVKKLIVNGILSIANGDHPAVVQEKLVSFLSPSTRAELEASVRK